MSRSQDHLLKSKPFFSIDLNRFYLMPVQFKIGKFRIKMYFPARLYHCFPHSSNDLGQFIGTDMGMCFYQNIRISPKFHEPFQGRATWTHTADRVDVEIVLRAHLAGSGWREYQATGSLWENSIPEGFLNSDKLPEVLLTPTTKDEKDLPISWEEASTIIGDPGDAARIRELSFKLFEEAADRAAARGERAGCADLHRRL